MRIVVETVDDFLAELIREYGEGHVWRNQVRYRISLRPEQKEAFSFQVGICLTAVIEVDKDDQFVLELEHHCGVNDRDEKPPDAGTQAALEVVKRIGDAIAGTQIQIRLGKIEQF